MAKICFSMSTIIMVKFGKIWFPWQNMVPLAKYGSLLSVKVHEGDWQAVITDSNYTYFYCKFNGQ